MRLRLPHFSAPSFTSAITGVVVAVCVLFVIGELEPKLLIMNSTTAGGDMGAHTWTPQFLIHHLLPHGRITGWSPDWYDGYPALTFYFPLPSLMVAVLNLFIPYAVAFKFVTVSGVVTLPIAAWAFGRLSRLPFPAPACLAAATIPFLFDTGYTILGGNIASTLAGEFAFSIGLSLALVFLGLVAGGLETGRRRWIAALLFGAIIICHILASIFALVGGLILVGMRLLVGGLSPDKVDAKRDEPTEPVSGEGGLGARPPAPVARRRIARRPLGLLVFASAACFVLLLVTSSSQSLDVFAGYAFFGCVAGLIALVVYFVRHGAPVWAIKGKGSGARVAALKWTLPVGIIGALLSAVWAVPFVLQSQYMNDMGWEKIGTGTDSGMKLYSQTVRIYTDALFPFAGLWGVLLMAFLSACVGLFLLRRMTIFVTLFGAVFAVGFVIMPQGRLWNARLLPLYYLSLYLLAGLLIAEIGWSLADTVRKFRNGQEVAEGLSIAAPLIAVMGAFLLIVPTLPPPGWWPLNGTTPWHSPTTNGANFIPSWATWNYSGYEGKHSGGAYYKPAHVEYQALVDTMSSVGRQDGCGRAMWEYEPTLDRFGTPMALMLLPIWTNGCIGSMEGLFFESSATTPYHFLNQALLSQTPSSAQRNLPYGSLNVSNGVTKLQLMGVKYYIAVSPQAQQQAALDPRLSLIATTPAAAGTDGAARTWNVYSIADSDIVTPLQNLPNVMTSPKTVTQTLNGAAKPHKLNDREAWLENSVNWYGSPDNYVTLLASWGPKNWPRIANADQVQTQIPVADPVNVSYIGTSDDRISFNVDRVGVPVLVKASYFPDWKATGAKGPYRVSPNLMVVIPTSHHVDLHYGRAGADWLGIALSLLGAAGVVWLYRKDHARGKWVEPTVVAVVPSVPLGTPYEPGVADDANGLAAAPAPAVDEGMPDSPPEDLPPPTVRA